MTVDEERDLPSRGSRRWPWDLGDSDAHAGVERVSGAWRFTGASFSTPYGADLVETHDLGADGTVEVVSAETMNDIGEWTMQVWRWTGERLGCTPHMPAEEQLPDPPDLTTLSPRHCWGGA